VAVSNTATQTPSVPATAAATATPTGTYRPGTIATFAGSGAAWFSGSAATDAGLGYPTDLAVDNSGNVFIADAGNARIRRVAAETGVVTTIAGTGVVSFGGDGGPASSAGLNGPWGLAVDDGGNVFIADMGNHRIRRLIAATGVITTVAGTGVGGFSGDGGPATSASLLFPMAVLIDQTGNVLIADSDNHRIRRVAIGTGIITTVAGTGAAGLSGDGGAATSASLNRPLGLTVDVSGNLFIADLNNHRIRRVAAGTGLITTVAGSGVAGFSGDGGPAASAALQHPHSLVINDDGNLIFTDFGNHRIRQVAADTGVITTLAGTGLTSFTGDGGPATSADLHYPHGLAVDDHDNLLFVDRGNNRVRIISAAAQPSPTATPTPSPSPLCAAALFRPLPRTDLVGSLVGTALAPAQPVALPTEAACRQACCDAAACDGYSFDASSGAFNPLAHCFLFVNVTQLIPSNTMASGVRESALL
jgi:hypothetical protein